MKLIILFFSLFLFPSQVFADPIITLIGDNSVTLIEGETFVDLGATAHDEEDGTLTSLIQISSTVNMEKPGTYQVIYSVTDSDGNNVAEVRTVDVISIGAVLAPIINFILSTSNKPSITLIGNNEVNLTVGDTFTDPGAIAIDTEDGNLTSSIEINSTVDTSVAGAYVVTYTVTDSDGNSASVMRTVIVLDIVYEDAEDGLITGWSIYDNNPLGASITNVYDAELDSQVIQLSGDGTRNGYKLQQELPDGSFVNWNNIVNTNIRWKMKYAENFKIYVKVNTLNGVRYLLYANYSKPASNNDALYLWYDISNEIASGVWQNVSRNLRVDLKNREPANDLTEIDAFWVKGSGFIDDVEVFGTHGDPLITRIGDAQITVTLGDTFNDPGATAVDNEDGNLTASIDINSTVDTSVAGTYVVTYTVTDSDGNSAFVLRDVIVFDPALGTLYEDAEDGNTLGWFIYDTHPAGASITNVYDADKDSFVIDLSGAGLSNKYVLRNDDAVTYWKNRINNSLEWDMKYSESFEIDIKIDTLQGTKHLVYTDASINDFGLEDYIKYGLGESLKNGTWQTVNRNLIEDLKNAQPDNEFTSILDFRIRGSGHVDNIRARGVHSFTPLNRTGYIKRSSEDASILGDLEAIQQIEPGNEFAIADDQQHLMYRLDFITGEIIQIISDAEFGAYTQVNPNGFEPLNPTCVYDASVGTRIGFCDAESIAYDSLNDIIYIYSGNHPGELSTFKLTRSAPDQNFTILDWKRPDYEHSASIFIGGELYTASVDAVTEEGILNKMNWDTQTVVGSPILRIGYEIQDMAYGNGNLWILTSPTMLYKIDFTTMNILDSYDMYAYDIKDPRGVEVQDGKLYIGDGDDYRTDDLLHAIHIFDLP